MPFIDEILNSINTIICDLQPQQVLFCLLTDAMLFDALVFRSVSQLMLFD